MVVVRIEEGKRWWRCSASQNDFEVNFEGHYGKIRTVAWWVTSGPVFFKSFAKKAKFRSEFCCWFAGQGAGEVKVKPIHKARLIRLVSRDRKATEAKPRL